MSKYTDLQLKINKAWTPSSLFFKDFDQKSCDSEEMFLRNGYYCRTPISGCFCILYCLWVRNSKSSRFFFNIFICTHSRITNVVIPWRRLVRFIMLQWTGMGTPLSCYCAVSSFSLSSPYIWINPTRKLYDTSICQKLKTLTSFFKFDINSYSVKNRFFRGFLSADVRNRKSGLYTRLLTNPFHQNLLPPTYKPIRSSTLKKSY